MSWAGVTVAVLPDDLAQAAAACLTASVSAWPEEPMRICRLAGPEVCWLGWACWSLKPLPQAGQARTGARASSANRGLMGGSFHLWFRCGPCGVERIGARPEKG